MIVMAFYCSCNCMRRRGDIRPNRAKALLRRRVSALVTNGKIFAKKILYEDAK